MGEPTFLSEDKICFGDIEIFLLKADNAAEIFRDYILFMYKSIGYVQTYGEIKKEVATVNSILEIGVGRGGSAAFLHKFFDAHRVVCIEVNKDPQIPLERYRNSTGDAVKVYYGVNQADRSAVNDILQTEFPEGIDLVIDDGSHAYEPTRATFEIAFPYVRNGGIYIIEDWNWAHGPAAQKTGHYYADRKALTNLVFELVMVHGGTGIIDYIGLQTSMIWVRRAWHKLPKGSFRVNDYIFTRGQQVNLI